MDIKIMLVDDEIEYLEWLVDYIEMKGAICKSAEDIGSAMSTARSDAFDFFIVDLNIPLGNFVQEVPNQDYSEYQGYYGLYFIRKMRSLGISGSKIVAYSVHRNEIISNAIEKLGCQYIAKGRPRELKDILNMKVFV